MSLLPNALLQFAIAMLLIHVHIKKITAFTDGKPVAEWTVLPDGKWVGHEFTDGETTDTGTWSYDGDTKNIAVQLMPRAMPFDGTTHVETVPGATITTTTTSSWSQATSNLDTAKSIALGTEKPEPTTLTYSGVLYTITRADNEITLTPKNPAPGKDSHVFMIRYEK